MPFTMRPTGLAPPAYAARATAREAATTATTSSSQFRSSSLARNRLPRSGRSRWRLWGAPLAASEPVLIRSPALAFETRGTLNAERCDQSAAWRSQFARSRHHDYFLRIKRGHRTLLTLNEKRAAGGRHALALG